MSCTVSGLTNGTSYHFIVRAFDSAGGGPSSTLSAVAVTPILGGDPGTPGTPVASPLDQGAEVTWTAPITGGGTIDEYVVTSSPSNNNSKQCIWKGGPLQCDVMGLLNGHSYGFTVQAVNPAGASPISGTSNPVTPAGPPSKPGTPVASAGIGSATITWSAPMYTGGSPITRYVVSPLPGEVVQTGNPTAQTCTVTLPASRLTCSFIATSGSLYQFVVRAYNALGAGATSTPSNVVIPGGS
jgi:titin